MSLTQALVLALLQGLTEFLPISSSGHLILTPHFLGWKDQGLAFDVAVHLGTLLAVMLYFRRDLVEMALAGTQVMRGGEVTPPARMLLWVALATIPAGLVGLLFNDFIETALRSPAVIAATTIGFGLLLWLADVLKKETRTERDLSWRDALLIGGAQALALIPGTSRSGITMTAGLALGLGREAAARFSFLMSIPVILLASGLQILKLLSHTDPVNWSMLLTGVVASAVSAYLCIRLFLKWIGRMGFMPFAIYRVVLGIVILMVLV